MLDLKLITDFRDKINDNNSWCYFKYHNNDNKNLWSCICSATDWIEVSAQYISSHDIYSLDVDQGIELYALLSSIDIIVEAIEQLHRVIFATKQQIFAADNDCFSDNIFGKPDRNFFKELRACFGAHSVNLADPKDPNNQKAKRFASWPSKIGVGDFSVILYSNQVEEENIFLGIEFNQLERFLNKYYTHLIALENELDSQYNKFCESKRHEKIECFGTPLEQLTILQEESRKRLNSEYYNNKIDEMIRIFRVPIKNVKNLATVEEYRHDLLLTIAEIKGNLQNMEFVDLQQNDYPQYDLPLPNAWGYFVEKLNEAMHGSGYPEYVWLPGLRRKFEGKLIFEYDSLEELYVIVHATLHIMAKSHASFANGGL